MGVILFIVSEVFAFLSVFWAFFHSSLSPSIEIGGVWPPQGVEALSAFKTGLNSPYPNIFILLKRGVIKYFLNICDYFYIYFYT